MLNLKGSQTEKNLQLVFAGEAQARNAFMYYAEAAQKAGYGHTADAFLEIAQNKGEHARALFEFLDKLKDTRSNLQRECRSDPHEHAALYPDFAKKAEEEGFGEIADFFLQMSREEKRQEEICRRLLQSLDEGNPSPLRTTGHSSITLAQLMLPHQANPAGYVHGGEMMKLMDNAAGVVASRHAHTNVVTARVEEIDFINPVKVGDLVMVHGRLTFVGRSSMEIRVRVETENLSTEEKQQALTAYFIYVALNPDGRPAPVPPLLITTEEGKMLFEAGRKRYEARRHL
jgi:acyl-CoA hydrolase/ferritin